MRFHRVAIAAIAHVDAPVRVATDEIAQQLTPFLDRIGLPGRALQGLTGIVARRFWPQGTSPSQAATLAAEQALSQVTVAREHVGVLINTSVCRDFVEPSTACLVHRNLGLADSCVNFDLANACLGFISGMDIAAAMIERGDVDAALVVDGEDSREVTERTIERLNRVGSKEDFRNEFAALTLGSGGAAALLVGVDLAARNGLALHHYVGGLSVAATQHNELCVGQRDKMVTDSNGLLRAGIELAENTWRLGCERFGWHAEYFQEHVLHQVSKTHTEQLMKRLGLDLRKTLPIYPEHGNVGPAAVPMVLSKAVEQGRVRHGERVALMGIGSGLNCAMVEVRW